MQNVNLNTLVPALVSLIVFVGTIFGKQLDQMNVEQVVVAVVTLVGTIIGIVQSHRKPTASQSQNTQPPAQP